MYLLLAVSAEYNHDSEARVRSALGWAGYLAMRQDDPFTLIEVADVLLIRHIQEIAMPKGYAPVRTGDLLDRAIAKAPSRPEPVLMSIMLAEEVKDPERLGSAVEELLSLGWPGVDEIWRKEARQKVEKMARELETEGRRDEAKRLLARLAKAEPRDLFLRLTWTGDAGLDLNVEEPLGASASAVSPRTVFGGAVVQSGRGKHPESVYVCPLGFSGDYKIRIDTLYNDQTHPVEKATLEIITHEGSADEKKETRNIPIPLSQPVMVHLDNGRHQNVLPFEGRTVVRLVPESQQSPGAKPGVSGNTTPVVTPETSEAADLLRVPGGAKPKPGGTIRLDPSRPKAKP